MPAETRPVTTLELQGMARVVRYLRDRAHGTYKTIEKFEDADLKHTHSLKALSLVEAAVMVEEGISRELGEADPDPTFKRWTVCSSCGHRLMVRAHRPGCPIPCYDDHIDPCPTCPPRELIAPHSDVVRT